MDKAIRVVTVDDHIMLGHLDEHPFLCHHNCNELYTFTDKNSMSLDQALDKQELNGNLWTKKSYKILINWYNLFINNPQNKERNAYSSYKKYA